MEKDHTKELADIRTQLALQNRDLLQITGIFERMDTTIEKLSDIADSLKQLIAVHAQRLDTQEKAIETLQKREEDRRISREEKDEEVSKKINAMNVRIATAAAFCTALVLILGKTGLLALLF